MNSPLPIGLEVPPYGKIIAVGWIGERYYWLSNGNGISMMPADVIERGKEMTNEQVVAER